MLGKHILCAFCDVAMVSNPDVTVDIMLVIYMAVFRFIEASHILVSDKFRACTVVMTMQGSANC